ncbi:hypothetical protein ACFVWY_05625 [Streptomyces sp. NPDC058195]|uniref:hypothetical protein n=1 Tax=Streptomyces sp. NPDC058195 TaxID=3346375 RepID=UPI0036E84C93
MLLVLHERMVNSHPPSALVGGYCATEGVAITETEILRDTIGQYGELAIGASGGQLPKLDHHRLHLDDDHGAAQVDGLSVEASRIAGWPTCFGRVNSSTSTFPRPSPASWKSPKGWHSGGPN